MTPLRKATLVFLVLVVLGWPELAHAQSGAIVNGAIGAFVSDNATNLEISGGIGYRFNRSIAFGIEFTQVPNFDASGQDAFSALRICCGVSDGPHAEGHATVFTTNVRVEVPTTMRRVLPFVVGGGGIASVTEKFPIIYYATPLASQLAGLGITVPVPDILPGPQQLFSNTTLAMALTLGGGASVLMTDHLSIDGDLRVLKLLADTGRTIGRFQVGASYRF
ncbi:MAG TPA: outer membrane beta-barrel protein [Vicinamibacterales bacterium]